MSDAKVSLTPPQKRKKLDATTFINKNETGIRVNCYSMIIIIKGRDISGKSHTLVISETYGYNEFTSEIPNSIWIGPIHVILGHTVTSGVMNELLRDIQEEKSLFFCIQKPVDIKTLLRHCKRHEYDDWKWNPCHLIFRNFKRFVGKQESAIVTRVRRSKLFSTAAFEQHILHSVFEHDVKGKIHGLKTQYQCDIGYTRQTNCNFYCHGKRVNRIQWKQYNQNLVIRVIGVTGIAKVLSATIILQYLFNIPSIFSQQLKVKLDYKLSIPVDNYVIEHLDFKFMRPFVRNYYTCSQNHRVICKCNVCKIINAKYFNIY